MFVFRENNKYGVVNQGEIIIPPVYKGVLIINNDITENTYVCAVDDELHCSLFDTSGKVKNPDEVHNNSHLITISIANNGGTIVISPDFKAVYHTQYDVKKVSDRIFCTNDVSKNGRYTIFRLNDSGDCWETVAENISDFSVILCHGGNDIICGKYYSFFKTGRVIVTENDIIDDLPESIEFDEIAIYGKTIQCPYFQYNETGIYDISRHCKLTSTEKYDACRWNFFVNPDTSDIVWYNGKVFSINDRIYSVTDDNSYFYVTKSFGKDTIFKIENNDRYFLLDTSSMQKSKIYDDIFVIDSSEIMYLTETNNKYGCIDENFNCIIPDRYNNIKYVRKNKTFIISKDNKYGRADLYGKIISPIIWDYMSMSDARNNNYIQVSLNNKIGTINTEGKVIIEPVWDKALCGNTVSQTIAMQRKQGDKNIFAFIKVDDGRIILEDTFESGFDVKSCFGPYILINKDGKTALYNTLKEKYEVEYSFGSITYNNLIISIDTLNETREIRG